MVHSLLLPSIILASTAVTAGATTYVMLKKPGIAVKAYFRYTIYSTGLRCKYLQVDKYRMCYAERGARVDGEPSVLFVHGFTSGKEMWVPLVKELPRDLHIVLVDLPGHGDSSIPGSDDDISLMFFVHCLHKFVQLAGLNRQKFHIVGVSLGGAITALYAAEYPDTVARVTLICPAMRTPVETPFQIEVRQRRSCLLIPSTTDGIDKMINTTRYKKMRLPKQVLEGILQYRRPRNEFYKRLYEHIRELATANSADAEELEKKIQEVDPPTQIIWGRDDEIIHVSGAEKLHKIMKNCQRVDIINECGHSATMDYPVKAAQLLVQFRKEDL